MRKNVQVEFLFLLGIAKKTLSTLGEKIDVLLSHLMEIFQSKTESTSSILQITCSRFHFSQNVFCS
jgi:hypothetical protein